VGSWAIAHPEMFKNMFSCWVQQVTIILPPSPREKINLFATLTPVQACTAKNRRALRLTEVTIKIGVRIKGTAQQR